MALTDVAVRALKARSKPYKVSDGSGLYLVVQPSCGKLWRMDYQLHGKRRTVSFGVYPRVGRLSVSTHVRADPTHAAAAGCCGGNSLRSAFRRSHASYR